MWKASSYLPILTLAGLQLLQGVASEPSFAIQYEVGPDQIYEKDDDYDGEGMNIISADRHTRKIDNETAEYILTCGRLFAMSKTRSVIINSVWSGKKQYPAGVSCEWNFLGTPDCVPEISCEIVDVRCSVEHLLIIDGMYGGISLCDNSHQGSVWKASSGRDIFVSFSPANSTTFSRLHKGFKCRIKCAGDETPKLPANSDVFKIEPTCECGKFGTSQTRIVGGTKAKEFEFPWIVSLVSPGRRFTVCGGTLINSFYVLSAAHCFAVDSQGNPPNYDVLIHAHDLSKSDAAEKTVRRKIDKFKCHRWYNKAAQFDFDVCLIKLNEEVDITKHSPACLPEPQTPITDDKEPATAVAAGWGTTAEGSTTTAKILQKVNVPVVSHTKCMDLFANQAGHQITSNMLCAGYEEGGKDACQGDSGGPLITKKKITDEDSRGVLIGIVSWGVGCARQGVVGIYSRVSEFVPWIRKMTRIGKWCKG